MSTDDRTRDRDARLARALRDNLRRRKAQARGRRDPAERERPGDAGAGNTGTGDTGTGGTGTDKAGTADPDRAPRD